MLIEVCILIDESNILMEKQRKSILKAIRKIDVGRFIDIRYQIAPADTGETLGAISIIFKISEGVEDECSYEGVDYHG